MTEEKLKPMNITHTPWSVSKDGCAIEGAHDTASNPDGKVTIATVVQSDESFGAILPIEAEANAKLMAAAPALLAACQLIIKARYKLEMGDHLTLVEAINAAQ